MIRILTEKQSSNLGSLSSINLKLLCYMNITNTNIEYKPSCRVLIKNKLNGYSYKCQLLSICNSIYLEELLF